MCGSIVPAGDQIAARRTQMALLRQRERRVSQVLDRIEHGRFTIFERLEAGGKAISYRCRGVARLQLSEGLGRLTSRTYTEPCAWDH